MSETQDTPQPVGLLRRLAAMVYDSFLLFGVLVVAGAASVPLSGPYLEQGEYPPAYSLYLLSVMYLYFAWQWRRGGQTLAMQTWYFRVEREDGGRITWRLTLVRFMLGWISLLCLGAGFWWALVDKQKRTWHDIGSGTRLVRVEKERRKGED